MTEEAVNVGLSVRPLASSSKGNAYLVRYGDETLLIDDGLSYRELRRRWEAAAGAFCAPSAVLLTHSHGDHVQGLPTLLKRHPEVVVYANCMTADSVSAQLGVDGASFACFENGQEFEIGSFVVRAFSIPHDTSDPVGYVIRVPATEGPTCYFHGTDIGTPLDSIGLKLAEADIAVLESNHDPVMLRTSGRAPCLIQRIAGPRGHLSNDESAALVRRFASPRLRRLYLAHLSADCNTPTIAAETMRAALAAMGRADIALEVCAP